MEHLNGQSKENFAEKVDLYVLKHKDKDVAMVRVNTLTGEFEYVLDVYEPAELPVGCKEETKSLAAWWNDRAIPDSRRGIQKVLHYMNERTSKSLMLASYGLSLTDHYWLQPIDKELRWKDLNFYTNDFSNELGELLTETGEMDINRHISKFSPASSVNGEMKKKWVVKNGTRYLMKVNLNHYGQQAVNEVIATRLHERLGWSNYAPYQLGMLVHEGEEYPYSLNPMFTSENLEFVSGYQLIRDYKVPGDMSEYECIIKLAGEYGLAEQEIRRQLEYTILTDFILTNTDRHYNNFGFLYNSEKNEFVKMAPVFDSGNSLFYEEEHIPTGQYLLEISTASFLKKEVQLLQYVKHSELADLGRLEGFSGEAGDLFREYTDMPGERVAAIESAMEQKIEYLRLFMQGKKIWKRKKFW